VRREVFARDGEQCTFTDDHGARCPSRTLLELDHIESRARGGSDEASNLRVRCRAHNVLHAEAVFGRAHVAARVHLRQQKRRGDVPAEVAAPPPARHEARPSDEAGAPSG
jgi:5-methylcytosine-specific restriction endonuclease McrA